MRTFKPFELRAPKKKNPKKIHTKAKYYSTVDGELQRVSKSNFYRKLHQT